MIEGDRDLEHEMQAATDGMVQAFGAYRVMLGSTVLEAEEVGMFCRAASSPNEALARVVRIAAVLAADGRLRGEVAGALAGALETYAAELDGLCADPAELEELEDGVVLSRLPRRHAEVYSLPMPEILALLRNATAG